MRPLPQRLYKYEESGALPRRSVMNAMIYLILAVLASSLVAVLMRIANDHVKNNYAMFMANYFVCSAIAYAYMGGGNPFAAREGLGFAIILGLISGSFYLLNFVLLKLSIGRNGVTLASVFMKLGVIVPALIAIIVFKETPGVLQIAGIVLALAAIVLIYLEPSEKDAAVSAEDKPRSRITSGPMLLLILLVVSGLTESMANIYDKAGTAAAKEQYLLFNFFTAFTLSAIFTAASRKRITGKDILFGVMIGVPNYHATRFLLLSLGSVPAVVVYPVYNVGAIVLIGLAGMLLFKEKLSRRKLCGFAMIIAALVLLNLG